MNPPPAFRPAAPVPADAGSGSSGPVDPATRPTVERIADWSARHRATAVWGWLVLVACAVVLGHALGTRNLPTYDPGQAGRAERMLSRPGVAQQPTESVLIHARSAWPAMTTDPRLRLATRVVAGRL